MSSNSERSSDVLKRVEEALAAWMLVEREIARLSAIADELTGIAASAAETHCRAPDGSVEAELVAFTLKLATVRGLSPSAKDIKAIPDLLGRLHDTVWPREVEETLDTAPGKASGQAAVPGTPVAASEVPPSVPDASAAPAAPSVELAAPKPPVRVQPVPPASSVVEATPAPPSEEERPPDAVSEPVSPPSVEEPPPIAPPAESKSKSAKPTRGSKPQPGTAAHAEAYELLPWKPRGDDIVRLHVAVPGMHREEADRLCDMALTFARTGDMEHANDYDRQYGKAVWKRKIYRAVYEAAIGVPLPPVKGPVPKRKAGEGEEPDAQEGGGSEGEPQEASAVEASPAPESPAISDADPGLKADGDPPVPDASEDVAEAAPEPAGVLRPGSEPLLAGEAVADEQMEAQDALAAPSEEDGEPPQAQVEEPGPDEPEAIESAVVADAEDARDESPEAEAESSSEIDVAGEPDLGIAVEAVAAKPAALATLVPTTALEAQDPGDNLSEIASARDVRTPVEVRLSIYPGLPIVVVGPMPEKGVTPFADGRPEGPSPYPFFLTDTHMFDPNGAPPPLPYGRVPSKRAPVRTHHRHAEAMEMIRQGISPFRPQSD